VTEADRFDRRTLRWDGCLNVRDLGGLPLPGGGETAFGAVIRADSVRQLSDDGWRALADHGVTRIVDLRYGGELALDPRRELATEVVNVPVLPDLDDPAWDGIEDIASAAPTPGDAVRDVYLAFLERFGAAFAQAVEALGEAPRGVTVVHCQEGKDRTGLVCALALRLAGVSVANVAADYAFSAVNLRARHEAWIARAPDDAERERRRRMTLTPAAAMLQVLETVEEQHGDSRGYLLDAGADPAALAAVAARLAPDGRPRPA
jgi:hypothetical protein